jgi:dynamin-binding protein
MTTLLKLHDGPQKIMGKRNKRVIDYARYMSVKERGEKPDKRTQEQADQFMALNDTLKEELPKLFSLTAKLVAVCLENFVEIQVQWQIIWQEKLKCILDEHQVPKDIVEIVEQFSGDFTFMDTQVSGLCICNGSLLIDRFSLLSHQTTNSQDSASSRRLPTLDSRSRGLSLNSEISSYIPAPDFEKRHSGGFAFSPLSDRLPELSGAPVAPGRLRANSTSSRPSPTPELSSGLPTGRSFSVVTPPTVASPPRPSTGRSATDVPVGSRPPSGSTYFSANQDLQRAGASPRPTSIFSSAMPMPDSKEGSPNPSRPTSPHSINVLFLAASLFEFNIDKARKEAGYPYLTYVPGEVSSYPQTQLTVSLVLIHGICRFSTSLAKKGSSGSPKTKTTQQSRSAGFGHAISPAWPTTLEATVFPILPLFPLRHTLTYNHTHFTASLRNTFLLTYPTAQISYTF